jgi:hypothetical protein
MNPQDYSSFLQNSWFALGTIVLTSSKFQDKICGLKSMICDVLVAIDIWTKVKTSGGFLKGIGRLNPHVCMSRPDSTCVPSVFARVHLIPSNAKEWAVNFAKHTLTKLTHCLLPWQNLQFTTHSIVLQARQCHVKPWYHGMDWQPVLWTEVLRGQIETLLWVDVSVSHW